MKPPNKIYRGARKAEDAYHSKMEQLQNALVNLIGTDGAGSGTMRTAAARMAASEPALMAMKIGLPIAAVAAPAIEIGNNESYANQGMDLLGMGAGAYGMHRGLVGRPTAALPRYGAIAGAGAAGLLASDVIQSLLGGGEG